MSEAGTLGRWLVAATLSDSILFPPLRTQRVQHTGTRINKAQNQWRSCGKNIWQTGFGSHLRSKNVFLDKNCIKNIKSVNAKKVAPSLAGFVVSVL